MCGIVGLLLRARELRPTLGQLLTPMFECMAERGPDSAGVAVFSPPGGAALLKVSLRARATDFDWAAFVTSWASELGPIDALEVRGNHALVVSALEPGRLSAWLGEHAFPLSLLSIGYSVELFKDQGDPLTVARAYGFSKLEGSHAVGHTRMATESKVSPAHAHPYSAGLDFVLVHNGSLSNPYMLRRKLEAHGLQFETDNDSEVACRYLEWRVASGEDLEQAIQHAQRELDGFYTFLIGTAARMTLVRDRFACKPAVVAECEDYVAVASEFRALSHLPGIERAHIHEPLPERIYTWTV